MSVPQTNRQKGFTIIEVVLVLAIAALIFLMVFIALPQLQKSQRDTQRRDDLGRISTQVNSYQSANRGAIPTNTQFVAATSGFVTKYLDGTGPRVAGDSYADPTTGSYNFNVGTASNPSLTSTTSTITYAAGSVCGVDGATSSAGSRNFSLRIQLENQKSAYCIDNK